MGKSELRMMNDNVSASNLEQDLSDFENLKYKYLQELRQKVRKGRNAGTPHLRSQQRITVTPSSFIRVSERDEVRT